MISTNQFDECNWIVISVVERSRLFYRQEYFQIVTLVCLPPALSTSSVSTDIFIIA